MNNNYKNIYGKYFFYFSLLIIIFLYRFPTVFYHFIDWDEASLMSEAWAMTKGQILYKDIYHIHPIFHFYVFIPFFLLLPNIYVPIAVKIFNIILIFIGAILINKIVKKITNDEISGFLSSIFFTFYLSFYRWTHSSYGEFYSLFPTLLAAYLIIDYKQYKNKELIISGFLCGVSFFIKQVAIFDTVSFIIFLIFFNKSLNIKIKFSYFSYGFILSTLLAFVYPFYHNSVYESLQSMFFHNIKSYTNIESNFSILIIVSFIIKPLFLIKEFFLSTVNNLSAYIYIISIFIFALIYLPFTIKLNNYKTNFITLLFSAFWTLIIFFGVSLIGRFYSHYFIQMVISISLLFGFISFSIPNFLKKMLLIIITISFLIISSIHFKVQLRNDFINNTQVKKAFDISKYIKENSNINDTLFLFKAEDLNLFYLTELLSPNGIYMFSDMDSSHTKDIKNEILNKNKLLTSPPNILIVGPLPTNTSSTLEIFFKELIDNKYNFQKKLYDLNIYFLKK